MIFLSIFMGVLRISVLKNIADGLRRTEGNPLIQKEDNLNTVFHIRPLRLVCRWFGFQGNPEPVKNVALMPSGYLSVLQRR